MSDIYDGADWTKSDLDDLKGAIAEGFTVEEAAQFLCRSGTVEQVREKCRELGLTPPADPVAGIPRGKHIGRRLGEPPADEAEHFIKCPACGGWIDCRDLGAVLDHEGPLPHPPADRPQ